jgi:hypothetical protein
MTVASSMIDRLKMPAWKQKGDVAEGGRFACQFSTPLYPPTLEISGYDQPLDHPQAYLGLAV